MPRDVLDVATEAALRAGAELTARYGRPPRGLGAKQGPTDLVSDADRAAEAAIAAVLARRRPDDGILGEEGTANRDGTTGLRWVVDPLDGTVNYLSGIPLWCVSIACEDAAGTLAGVVYDPLRDAALLRRPRRRRCASTAAARGRASTTTSRPPSIAGGVACATDAEAKRAAQAREAPVPPRRPAPRARHRRARAGLDGGRPDRRRATTSSASTRGTSTPGCSSASAPGCACTGSSRSSRRPRAALPRRPGRPRRRGARARRARRPKERAAAPPSARR